MKIIALEEHVVTPAVLKAWQALDPQWQELALKPSSEGKGVRSLAEVGPDRFAAMDAAGVDVQVISLTTPGLQDLDPYTAMA